MICFFLHLQAWSGWNQHACNFTIINLISLSSFIYEILLQICYNRQIFFISTNSWESVVFSFWMLTWPNVSGMLALFENSFRQKLTFWSICIPRPILPLNEMKDWQTLVLLWWRQLDLNMVYQGFECLHALKIWLSRPWIPFFLKRVPVGLAWKLYPCSIVIFAIARSSPFESAITFSPKQHVKDVKMQYYYFITVSYGSDPFFF